MSKNKKFTDSRLREIALMTSKGLPAELIADVTGLPQKSVANICWIYKWSPEKLDEMTERCKHRGKRGEYARSCLRQYFIMHPEQRPSPLLNLFREDQNKPEPVCQSEIPETMREADRDFVGDFKRTLCQKVNAEKPPYLKEWPMERRVTRLEDLANCFRGEFNQLKKVNSLSDKVGEMGERIEEIDRSVGATHNLICSYASRISNAEKILKQDVIDGNAHSRIEELRRFIRHDVYLMSKQTLMLFRAATDDKPAIELDELLADVQESVNCIEPNIEALREIE